MKPKVEHPRIQLKPKTRTILLEWLFIIVTFTLMMYLFYFFSWWSLEDYIRPNVFHDYMDSGYAFLEIFIQGTLFGVMFGLINLLIDNSKLRRKSFGAIIIVKTLLYSLAIFISQIAVYAIYHAFSLVPLDLMRDLREQISPRFMVSMSVYFTLVVLLINFFLQMYRKFGYGVFFSMITGKYHKPRQEQRVFMFLDMRDSTKNAEKLGHIKYSRLIQSCIQDLTDLIIRYKAQVYQYVGDEVVLTWPTRVGVKDQNCINLFYAFEQKLNDRLAYYEQNYNTLPEFKAGIDEGLITVTEVGDIKREIAYHGEVLITAARLEKMCNNLEKKLLVTQNLIEYLPSDNGYHKELIGEFQLRGKEHTQKVFGVLRTV